MAKKNAQNSGTIKHRTDGRWEARFSYKDELGQPKRGSVYGATQKECRQKLTAALKAIDDGTYHKAPQRYTVSGWFKEWLTTYCTTLREMTRIDYQRKAEKYIYPNIGDAQLAALTPMQVQRFCNKLTAGYEGQKPLSAKTVKNIHGILHSALKQAVVSGIIPRNPSDNVKLPKVRKPDLRPLMDEDINRFLEVIKGDRYERVYIFTLFSGMRQSEVLGLQWDDVDFETGEVTVCRQLQRDREGGGNYSFIDETKNGKSRIVPLSQSVMQVLRDQKRQQAIWQLAAGDGWNNDHNLVFTDELGGHLKHVTVYKHFKKYVEEIGSKETRFHDLRHSCAIMELQAGCSVKSIQSQLGHFSSSFTMDTYAAVSNTMKKDTQDRMEQLFQQAYSS